MLDSPLFGERAGLAARSPGQIVIGLPRDGDADTETPVTVAEYRGLKQLGMGDPAAFGSGEGFGARLKIGFFRFVEDTIAATGDVVNGTGELFVRGDTLMAHIAVSGESPLETPVRGVPVVAMRARRQHAEGWDQELARERALEDVLPAPLLPLVLEARKWKISVRATPLTWERMYAGYTVWIDGRFRIDVTGPSSWLFPWELAPYLDREATARAIAGRLDADEPADVVENFESRYLASASVAARYRRLRATEREGGLVEKTCVVCGHVSEHALLRERPRELDGRPEELAPPEVCACGHVAPDIGAHYRRYDREAEKSLLALPDHDAVARQCLAAARLFHGIDDDLEARWVLRAAWADEAAAVSGELGGALRARAAPLLRGSHLVRAEVYRTAGDFETALVHVQCGLVEAPDPLQRKLFDAVATAIVNEDAAPLTAKAATSSATTPGLLDRVVQQLEPEAVMLLAERVRRSDADVVRDACAKLEVEVERNPAYGDIVIQASITPVSSAWKDEDPALKKRIEALMHRGVAAIRDRPVEVGADEPGLQVLIPKIMTPHEGTPAPLEPSADRFFAGDSMPGASTGPVLVEPWGKRALLSAPPSDAIRVVMEKDAANVARAEMLAREVCRRCAPWGVDAVPQRIVWRIEAKARFPSYVGAIPLRAVWDQALSLRSARLSLCEMDVQYGRHQEPHDLWKRDWRRRARYDLIRANAWRAAVAADKKVPARVPAAAQGRRLAELEDPLAPIMEIWALGYALVAVTPEAIVLVGAL